MRIKTFSAQTKIAVENTVLGRGKAFEAPNFKRP
jgi:hypothetical protein